MKVLVSAFNREKAFSGHCETSRMFVAISSHYTGSSHTSPAPPSRRRARQRRQHRDKLGRGYMLSTCYLHAIYMLSICYKELRNNIRMKSTVVAHLLLVYMWPVFVFFHSPPTEEGLLLTSQLTELRGVMQRCAVHPIPAQQPLDGSNQILIGSLLSRVPAPGSWGCQEGSTIWKWETIWSMEKLQLRLSLLQ